MQGGLTQYNVWEMVQISRYESKSTVYPSEKHEKFSFTCPEMNQFKRGEINGLWISPLYLSALQLLQPSTLFWTRIRGNNSITQECRVL